MARSVLDDPVLTGEWPPAGHARVAARAGAVRGGDFRRAPARREWATPFLDDDALAAARVRAVTEFGVVVRRPRRLQDMPGVGTSAAGRRDVRIVQAAAPHVSAAQAAAPRAGSPPCLRAGSPP
ncbi:hypothetical protein [Bailinhaonella thermotolerans]|uniref:Uncharacterized protein n=1 Tax=Bailinhaonella thermotolerans TaxID=1070861 RepID=A0A3A4BK21_9ACTN|nr:hypothetical protein [Bailinhaonella thermotolerans]RJL35644.1 hypothetical protein D5H75_02320 [Bailinhaonella thermotolerans]